MGSTGSKKLPPWQNEYNAVLRETNRERLFMHIEIAEAAVRMRLEAIDKSTDYDAERQAITDALAKLDLLKKRRLGYYGTGADAIT